MNDLQVLAEESAEFPTPATTLYNILADYKVGHPAIVPPHYIKGITVKEGGEGAGTIADVEFRILGMKRIETIHVSEPEPGRLLMEESPTNGLRTTFTVDPIDENRCRLTLKTLIPPPTKLAARIENAINRIMARRIMLAEFEQIRAYLA